VQRFQGGLVFKAHILCVSLNSRLESNKAEEGYRTERESVDERLDLACGLVGLEDRECVPTRRLQSRGPINPSV